MARRCEPLTETRDVTTADLLRTLIDRVEHVCVEVALARVDIARHDAKIDLLLDRKHALTRADRALLVVMLPPIAGAFGSHAFASREVRESRSPGVRLVCKNMSVKTIGKLLARAEGQPVDGYVVMNAGTELNVNLWKILSC